MYKIKADIFSGKRLRGSVVVSGEMEFEIKEKPEPIKKKGVIKVTNMAPLTGTCLTSVWAGIHDGNFDTYNRNEPIREAFERLVEDGNNQPLMEDFAMTPGTVWDGNVGSTPICPGNETSVLEFEFDFYPGTPLFFSYASMILPSNVS